MGNMIFAIYLKHYFLFSSDPKKITTFPPKYYWYSFDWKVNHLHVWLFRRTSKKVYAWTTWKFIIQEQLNNCRSYPTLLDVTSILESTENHACDNVMLVWNLTKILQSLCLTGPMRDISIQFTCLEHQVHAWALSKPFKEMNGTDLATTTQFLKCYYFHTITSFHINICTSEE